MSDEQGNNSFSDNDENAQPESLLPFAGNLRQPMPKGIIYNLLDYLELIDWTGRQIREKKPDLSMVTPHLFYCGSA